MEFLTTPQNARRLNLRCPFGCRDHHRRQSSRQRSAAYYKTAAGKVKKEHLNARRYRGFRSASYQPQEEPAPQVDASHDQRADELPVKLELRLEEVVLDESSLACSPMLPYVRMVLRLVEGFELSCDEVARLLRRGLRQHSTAQRRRTDYVLCVLHHDPP
jgi:hypothetical protein